MKKATVKAITHDSVNKKMIWTLEESDGTTHMKTSWYKSPQSRRFLEHELKQLTGRFIPPTDYDFVIPELVGQEVEMNIIVNEEGKQPTIFIQKCSASKKFVDSYIKGQEALDELCESIKRLVHEYAEKIKEVK